MKLPPGYVAGQGQTKATAYGGYGQRLLESMGWQKGDGLGKHRHGMTSAIEAKEKKDTIGVGQGQPQAEASSCEQVDALVLLRTAVWLVV